MMMSQEPCQSDAPSSGLLSAPAQLLSCSWHKLAYLTSLGAMLFGFSLRLEGRRHMPRKGPALLVANHQSFLDPVLVGLAAYRQLCFLARKTLFRHPLFSLLIRSLNAVPIDQDSVGKEGIRAILEELHQGQAVLVFPEGERTSDGAIHPLKPGVHLLIKRTQAPIVPVGIAGAFDAWPRWRKFPLLAPLWCPAWAGTIAVSIGRPLAAASLAQMPRQQAMDILFNEIKAAWARAERLRRKN